MRKVQNKNIRKVMQKLKKAKPSSVFLLGFSGGVDSRVLFDLCVKVDLKIKVLHVNHQLRKEADADEKFVRDVCKKSSVECKCVKRDVKMLAKKWKMGLEEVGRKVRREEWKKWQKKWNAEKIILAHNADDQVETILMNILRGCGVHGLVGMREEDDFFWRPMLDLPKEEIIKYAEENKLEWREDKSNKSLRFTRNKIRHGLLPLVKKMDAEFLGELEKHSKQAKKEAKQRKNQAKDWIKERKNKFFRDDFLGLSAVMRGEVLREIWINLHGEVEGFERERVREVEKLLKRNIGKKKIQFGDYWVFLDKGLVEFRLK